jgi:ribosomal protein L20
MFAAAQVPYSKFIFGLREDNILLDRKVLSQLAHYEPYTFKSLVDRASHMSKQGLAHRAEAAAKGVPPRC